MNMNIEFSKEEFSDIIEAFYKEKAIDIYMINNEPYIEFNNNKLIKLISDIGEKIIISRGEFDAIDYREAKLLLLILNKSRIDGINEIEIEIKDMICNMFVLENYYNFKSPMIEEENYIIALDNEVKIIINSLEEIERVTSEKFSIGYIVIDKGESVELQVSKGLRMVLKDLRRK